MAAVPHPKYIAHFGNPLYASRVLDSAPFGSDQGADLLHDIEASGGLPPSSSIETILRAGNVHGYFIDPKQGDIDVPAFIYAAGFLLLRFNAHIAEDDYRMLRSALVRLGNELDLEAIRTVVLPDLDAFVAQGTGV